MKKRNFVRFNSLIVAIALIIGIFGLSYVPGIYASPDSIESSSGSATEAQSDNSDATGAAFEQRMNEISDDSLYTDVGKYVYEVVSGSESEDAVSEDLSSETPQENEPETSEEYISEETTDATDSENEIVDDIEEEPTEAESVPEYENAPEEESGDEAAFPLEETTDEDSQENSEETTEIDKSVETDESTESENVATEENGTEENEVPSDEQLPVAETEITDSPSYEWNFENDEDFSEWILAGENKEYLEKLFLSENKNEISEIRARINEMENTELYQQVNRYIYAIVNADEEITEDSKVSYPWDDMTDEEFAEWVMSGEHDSYLCRILSDEEDKTPSDALADRVADMKNEELCAYVSQYLESLVASIEKNESESDELSEDESKKTYPWDSMTDEEFAEWILGGENNGYINDILKDVFKEYESEEKSETPSVIPDNNVAEDEPEEKTDKTENEAFAERVEKIEDTTLLEQVKSFIKELFSKEEEIECEFMTLVDEENKVRVEGELPKNVQMQVTRVALEEIEEFVGEGKKVIFAYDIKFFVDCKEYQPQSPLSVSVLPSEETENKISVKHISEDSETGEKEIESIRSKVSDDGEITFSADSFSVYYAVADEEETEYIYLDLYAGTINISNSGYTGYIFTTTDGVTTATAVSGAHSADNKYYIYQSSARNKSITGMVDGVFILPEYTPLEYNGKPWAEYITNNTDIEGIIAAWDSVASKQRTKTANSRSVPMP